MRILPKSPYQRKAILACAPLLSVFLTLGAYIGINNSQSSQAKKAAIKAGNLNPTEVKEMKNIAYWAGEHNFGDAKYVYNSFANKFKAGETYKVAAEAFVDSCKTTAFRIAR